MPSSRSTISPGLVHDGEVAIVVVAERTGDLGFVSWMVALSPADG